jgi:hypothetical protein
LIYLKVLALPPASRPYCMYAKPHNTTAKKLDVPFNPPAYKGRILTTATRRSEPQLLVINISFFTDRPCLYRVLRHHRGRIKQPLSRLNEVSRMIRKSFDVQKVKSFTPDAAGCRHSCHSLSESLALCPRCSTSSSAKDSRDEEVRERSNEDSSLPMFHSAW